MSNKVKFGLKNVHYAIVTETTVGGVTTSSYATPVAWNGAVHLEASPTSDDNTVFRADDSDYYIVSGSSKGFSGSFECALVPEDVEIITEDMPGWLVANNGILTIALDIELTDELIEEGIARELINRIQNLRKSSGLEITDRIAIVLEDRPEIHNAVLHCGEYIASQVLATTLELKADDSWLTAIEMDGYNVQIDIKKA